MGARRFSLGSVHVFAVLAIQIVAVILLALNLLTFTPFLIGTLEQLPPLALIYYGSELSWISAGKAISLLVFSFASLYVGGVCIWYAIKRHVRIIRIFAIVLGIQFIVGSVAAGTAAAALLFGSWWHLISLIAAIALALSIVAAAVVITITFSHLVDYARVEREIVTYLEGDGNE